MAQVGAETIARDAAAWLTATLAGISDAVLGVDALGIVQFLNPAAEVLLAGASTHLLGKPVAEILQLTHEKTGKPLLNPLLESLQQKSVAPVPPHCCLRALNGHESLVEGAAQPVHGQHGSPLGAVLVFRDMSPRRRLEERLRQAQKSDDLGQLRGGFAHDFNNLMTVVIGFSEMLLTKIHKGVGPAGFQDSLVEIKSAAERAAVLSQQLLALGRSRHPQIVLADLNELLLSMEKMLGRVLGERIRITMRPEKNLPPVRIDSAQILQAILQLSVNAREALPHGGEIVFATRLVEPSGHDNGSLSESRVELSVMDTGTGMDPETLARAFEPAFTTKPDAKGMGLPVVASIMRNCGGDIRLESEPERGTTAVLTFPAAVPAPLTAAEPAKGIGSPAANGSILLVEDADRVRRLLARILEDAGYTVFQAANGRAGLELCREHAGKIQLLITDVMMPEMSGPELVKALETMNEMPRVLFLSGYAGDALDREGLDPSQYHFLQKPFLGEALLQKVREVLGGEVDSSQ
jgi:two-component system, cell cycle sensor histidine kinase and response regulator CckA